MPALRNATLTDVNELNAVRNAALRDDATGAYTTEVLQAITLDEDADGYGKTVASDAFEVLVAETERVHGFGVVHPDDGQIHGLFVRPDAMSAGVGSQLLDRLEVSVAATGTTDVFALATLNAVDFYVSRGYERAGKQVLGTDPEIPVVRVEKTI